MSEKVLIVDDEKNIRMTLKQCLSNKDYDITLAINGEEALKKIKNDSFDLIFLDIKMPGLNGMEVLEKIRNFDQTINVIMMTAYGTIERAVEAMKLGAVDFIPKPFTPQEIRDIAQKVLDRVSLEKSDLNNSKNLIEYAKKCIIEKNYNEAKEYLKKAIAEDTQKPEPHNLLGVISEYNGDILTAQKYYRAALALDPTYKPADKNLERTVMGDTKSDVSLGEDTNDKE
ncbi:MAG: response regulator [Bacillota bacterium]